MSATLSEDGVYRYDLLRHTTVLAANPTSTVVFIGLNPSTADASVDDATVRVCTGYAARWGAARMVLVNLFAYRATDPRALLAANDPVGPDNDRWLTSWVDGRYYAVAAWGAVDKRLAWRVAAVRALLAPYGLHCLGLTKGGQPRHPLYMRKDTVPCLLPQ